MPEIKNVECDLIATAKPGLMTFQTTKNARAMTAQFLKGKAAMERKNDVKKPYKFFLSIKYASRKRTLSQNNLYWALVTVLSFEAYGEFGHEEETHEELLKLYAPRVEGKLTGINQPMRSRRMDTAQFSQLIERVFVELTSRGVEMAGTQSIQEYWAEWQNWRSKQGVDPLSDTYRDIEDYKKKVPFCEACMRYLWTTNETGQDMYIGHMAHIVGKGAGGRDGLSNRLGLCGECHIQIQHQHGWWELIERYPHIRWRIDKAYEAHGLSLGPKQPEREDLSDD